MTGLRGADAAVVALLISGTAVGGLSVAAQTAPDRSRPPALSAPGSLTLPTIQHQTLSNGLPIWMIESHEVPLVQLNLVIGAGAGDDTPGKFGIASFVAGMLDEGAGARSALEIADAIELLGATIATTISFDAAAIRINVPVEHLRDVLPIIADLAIRPTFAQKDIDRLRQERLTALLQARDDSGTIASLAFARVVFGPAHRYGAGLNGTEATLKAFSAQDLRAFHSALYQPSNATLVVVGDVTRNTVVPELEKHLGGWKSTGNISRPTHAMPAPTEQIQIQLVDKPDAEQSQIRIGWEGVPRSTPDFFPLLVMNTVLGGSFTSRLNQNLREEHGYTYGASSGFDMRLSAGPFIAGAAVQADKTADALREFFKELNAIRGPVTNEELTRAKNYIALGFPGEFETMADVARRLEELIVYRLLDDSFSRYVANVQAITPEAVRGVAERYIHPQRASVIVVGDQKSIEPGIRALNLGPVKTMSLDEVFGR